MTKKGCICFFLQKRVNLHLLISFIHTGNFCCSLSLCHRNWSMLPFVEPCASFFSSSSSSLQFTVISHLKQSFLSFAITVPFEKRENYFFVLLHTKLLLNLLPVNCVENGNELWSKTFLFDLYALPLHYNNQR